MTDSDPPSLLKDTPRSARFGPVSIAAPLAAVTKPILGKRGFANSALLADWPALVGSAVAHCTLPLRIQFPQGERAKGTLYVKVASSAFAPHLQHLEPLIVEKINGYFGWNAVARLKLVHGPIARSDLPSPPQTPPLPNDSDLSLQEALSRLRRVLKTS